MDGLDVVRVKENTTLQSLILIVEISISEQNVYGFPGIAKHKIYMQQSEGQVEQLHTGVL